MNSLRIAAAALAGAFAVPAEATVYPLPPDGGSVIGELADVAVSPEETLLDVGRRHSLGYEEMRSANPEIDAWLPAEGDVATLPLKFVLPDVPRDGIVLNLAEFRLYYFDGDDGAGAARVMTFPASIGRMDWATPLGLTRVTKKQMNPSWYPPESVRQEHLRDGDRLPAVVPPGPNNPLGSRALRLAIPGYLIHGTNKPAGVGMRVTHGCVRLFPEDIEYLYDHVAVGTPVRIVNQPIKAGWAGDALYLEVHPPLDADADAPTTDEPLPSGGGPMAEVTEAAARGGHDLTELTRALVRATETRSAEIDWVLAEEVVRRADGIPVVVGRAHGTTLAAD